MSDTDINSGSIRKILDLFLQKPKRQSTFKELRLEAREYSETEIRKSLQILKRTHLLEVSFERGRPKGGYRTEVYTISKEFAAFEKLFKMYLNYNYENFLKSNYFNKLVDFHGFMPILGQIKKEFSDSNFKKIASTVMMEHLQL